MTVALVKNEIGILDAVCKKCGAILLRNLENESVAYCRAGELLRHECPKDSTIGTP
jgi:exosome complex RNA-binding protein Csl4